MTAPHCQCCPEAPDFAMRLAAAIYDHRAELNASRIAHGEPGRVEIHVNPAVKRVRVHVLLHDECLRSVDFTANSPRQYPDLMAGGDPE